MSAFTDFFGQFFQPLNTAQKVLFGVFAVGIILVFTLLFYWALRPEYALLFGNLGSASAQEIVEDLESEGVNYRLEDGGSSIFVPRSEVHDLRLQFASQGSAASDHDGYELFDESTLGMTDFMQQVNKKRAIEGELARTIGSMSLVEHARVHLVLPERNPFEAQQGEASASVILTIEGGRDLQTSQVEGIASLVAGSVEHLNKSEVTILDQDGNELSDVIHNGDFASASNQMSIQKEMESYLTEKGQSMLDRVIGPGEAIVRVTTEHDFEQLRRQSENIDPDTRIIISEERRTDRTTDTRSQPIEIDEMTPPGLRNETITTSSSDDESSVTLRNYDVSSHFEEYEKPVGTLDRVSASVLLNYKRETETTDEGEVVVNYEPYTNEELNEIRDVLESALGIRLERGDELAINQFQFHDTEDDLYQQVQYEQPFPYNELLRWLLIFAAIAIAGGLLYGIMRASGQGGEKPFLFKIRPEVSGTEQGQKELPRDHTSESYQPSESSGQEQQGEEHSAEIYKSKLTPEAQRRLEAKSKMFEEIKNFAEFKSEDTANLVRSLMAKNKGGEQS